MTATAPDLLDLLDASAAVSLTTPGEIREAWLRGIQAVSDRDGDVDAARVRAIVPDWAHNGGSTVGALWRHLSKSGAAVMVGVTASGFSEHRASTSLIKKWRLTRPVWPDAN